jgi:hypothetical protein
LHWHGESRVAEIPWLIKGVLPQAGAGLLSGQWGTAKTFVALDLAGSVMTCPIFLDYRVKRNGGVLFIAKEGKAALPLRLGVMNEHKLGRRDDQPLPFAWADPTMALSTQGAAVLYPLVREMKAELRRRFDVDLTLIIIDTIPVAASYTSEKDGAEASRVMNALRALGNDMGVFVLGVEHFGKDVERGTRGMMTKEDNPDTILATLGDRKLSGQVDNLRLGLRKIKDSESGREIAFRLEVINCGIDEDGDAVSSCIVRWEPGRTPARAAPRPTKSTALFVTIFEAALDRVGNRQLFPGFVAVPEPEVREHFIRNWMANESVNQAAAGQRWRETRKAAIANGTVESKVSGEVNYLGDYACLD